MNHFRAALVVVDVQNGFINEHSEHAVPMVTRLVKAWSALGHPLVFTRFYNPPGSAYERITGWTGLRTEAEQQVVDELAPYMQAATAVIDKPVSSALTPELARLIADHAWTDLVLAGIDTDACVYDTAISTYHAGIRPWLVTDACASTGGSKYHDIALVLAERNISPRQLLTIDSLLSGSAGPLTGMKG